jgi:hypothetical protein
MGARAGSAYGRALQSRPSATTVRTVPHTTVQSIVSAQSRDCSQRTAKSPRAAE